MNGGVAILVASRDPLVHGLGAALQAQGIRAETIGDYAGAVACLETLSPVAPSAQAKTNLVAVIDGDLPVEVAFDVYRLLRTPGDVPTLILVGPGTPRDVLVGPNRPSLEEHVAKPVGVEELVLRVKALMLRAGYRLPEPGRAEGAKGVGLRWGCAAIVCSAKGGAGKTLVSLNLAVGLRHLFQLNTLLVDADLCFGDVAVLLNISSDKSIFDACAGEEVDLHALRSSVVVHSCGLSVLLRPPDLSMAERLDPALVVKAVQSCQAVFDFVVVDTHSALDELNLQLFEAADRILLVCTPEMSAVHNTARLIEIAQVVGFADKLALFINRADSGIRLSALQESFSIPISGTIPSAGRLVVEATNLGVPLLIHDSQWSEQLTRDFVGIVSLVAGRPLPEGAPAKTEGKSRRMFLPLGKKVD